jgi:hypothetical protein
MVSVAEGNIVTMRCGAAFSVMERPASSVRVRGNWARASDKSKPMRKNKVRFIRAS